MLTYPERFFTLGEGFVPKVAQISSYRRFARQNSPILPDSRIKYNNCGDFLNPKRLLSDGGGFQPLGMLFYLIPIERGPF